MAKFNHLDIRGTKKVPSAFGNVFICSGSATDAKTITFPDGFLNGTTPEPNLAFKCVFANGHNAANASSYLSLNGVVVVSNQNGTLAPIPVHAMSEGGSTVYKVLQANTILEMYYTSDYDGSQSPAFVIVGNPVVLSSADYTIYANGQKVLASSVPTGTIIAQYTKSNPEGYLYLDGRDTTGTSDELSTQHPTLYSYLGNTNVLPDYREFALVGAEQNTTDVYNALTNPDGTIHTHDTYNQGQSKDDYLQTHSHSSVLNFDNATTIYICKAHTPASPSPSKRSLSKTDNDGLGTLSVSVGSPSSGRIATVTRGKRKAVYWYIKY